MKHVFVVFFVFSLFSLNLNSAVLKGRITGYDGKPIPKSHVVHTLNYSQLDIVQAKSNGQYEIPITQQGSIEFTFSGINHLPLIVSFDVLDSTKDIELDVQLGAYSYEKDVQGLKIIGGFNNYDFAKAVDMENLGNGKYKYVLKNFNSDTLKYQVLGIVNIPEQRSVQGTHADFYSLDYGGDYYSVLVSKNRNFEIIYDTALLKYVDSKPIVNFKDEVYSGQYELNAKLEEFQNIYRRSFGMAVQSQQLDTTPEELYNLRKEYIALIQAQNHPILKEKVTIEYMSYLTIASYFRDKQEYNLKPVLELIANTPPNSDKVKKFSWYLSGMAKHQNINIWEYDYVLKVIETNPDKELSSELLHTLIQNSYYFDKDIAMKFYDRIIKEFPEQEATQRARQSYDPDRAMQVGRMVPDFTFISLDNPDNKITPASLKGKYVLIDMWATWCGPCIMEMDNLHETYQEFKDKGFEILSISIDPTVEMVNNFRKGKWKMPWLNAWSDGQFQSTAAQTFEVTGIPRFVLLDPTGEILAVDTIRGEGLKAMLAELLNK